MEIIHSPDEMAAWAKAQAAAGGGIALVPTMGCFHEAHLSLMRLARRQAGKVVVSLFVNPLQFGPSEDFEAYPRNFAEDCRMAAGEGVDAVFAPDPAEMYPEDFQTVVSVKDITRHLCGASRPGHFDGVATVLVKLFHLTGADCAVFGEKDYQQLAVIRRLTADLNMDIEIIGHPTVRETDGLAMSSRNLYLDEGDRESALSLYRSIAMARKLTAAGVREATVLERKVRAYIESFPGTEIDYVSFVDADSLVPVAVIDERTLLALAVRIGGKVRLIDNGLVLRDG
ncbi:MAG TPA: pantoate--beta-alanine ligase [Desulfobacteraceae bacterium]|nr:pantoate--beta-alanine ligase [Desulfobacteraceae bacterium]